MNTSTPLLYLYTITTLFLSLFHLDIYPTAYLYPPLPPPLSLSIPLQQPSFPHTIYTTTIITTTTPTYYNNLYLSGQRNYDN